MKDYFLRDGVKLRKFGKNKKVCFKPSCGTRRNWGLGCIPRHVDVAAHARAAVRDEPPFYISGRHAVRRESLCGSFFANCWIAVFRRLKQRLRAPLARDHVHRQPRDARRGRRLRRRERLAQLVRDDEGQAPAARRGAPGLPHADDAPRRARRRCSASCARSRPRTGSCAG